MTFDTDNDVDVYFRQALRATLFTPACCSVVLTGLKFIIECVRLAHKFHKYTQMLSVLIRANQWGYSSVFQILSFYISIPGKDTSI